MQENSKIKLRSLLLVLVGKRPPSQETIIHYLASQGNVDSLGILLKSGHFQVRRLQVALLLYRSMPTST